MALNDKLFVAKDITCPVCNKEFKRYLLKKKQFSLDKRDIDYRPVYLGTINPRYFNVCVCPHCLYAAEDKFFCPLMNQEDARRKAFLDNHKSQWEAANRVKAASSGQQIWKDLEAEKLRELTPTNIAILRQIKPLLERVAGSLLAKGKPFNELQRDGDLEAAIRSWELAAICCKARKANHRLLGYTYLNGAWTARDAAESTPDPALQKHYRDFEQAYLKEAISFLTITNAASGVDDAFMPDGSRIPKENIPQSRVFEIMYILAGANRLMGDIEHSNKFLEQIIYGSQSAQGIILWFVNQAREMRHETNTVPNLPIPQDEPDGDSPDEDLE
ncbi:MAG TPA: DUF2225 domain-containing protein [Candidatus Rifleibacterium sp.]|nr:DUF2225 domain-containing protein [Candidatus Rifleibacterium sp.]HPT47958.1 DUF2225 domain-containing protein [Candidatus Rifleibacterium sp.]